MAHGVAAAAEARRGVAGLRYGRIDNHPSAALIVGRLPSGKRVLALPHKERHLGQWNRILVKTVQGVEFPVRFAQVSEQA